MEKKTMGKDLTKGHVPSQLMTFALPFMLSNALQAVYSTVDMLVVGRVVGETGLAAVSNASMMGFIINSVCIGFSMGGTVLAAQYKGAGNKRGQAAAMGTLFSVSLLASFAVTAGSLAVYAPLLQWQPW